jgi:hypothetical protein
LDKESATNANQHNSDTHDQERLLFKTGGVVEFYASGNENAETKEKKENSRKHMEAV